jgi:hypothetical protein
MKHYGLALFHHARQNGASMLILGRTPRELTHTFGDAWMPQKEVSLEVEPEEPRGTPEHKVFRLVRALGKDGDGTQSRTGQHRFSGRVERLNYALHGEVNGGILESVRIPGHVNNHSGVM